MIRAIHLLDDRQEEISLENISTVDLSNVWLELVDPSTEELRAVSAVTSVSSSFLKLPKAHNLIDLRLETGVNILTFVVFNDISRVKSSCPIVFAFSKNFLITVAPKEIQHIIDRAKERLSKTRNEHPSVVAYYIIDEIVSEHFALLEGLESITAQIEEEVINGTPEKTMKKIFNIKTKMISLNKILWYERGIIYELKRCSESTCLTAKAKILFETVHEEITRQIDIVETYREILSDAINVQLSSTSNKINGSIKKMTLVMYYLTLITLVTSFPNTIVPAQPNFLPCHIINAKNER